MSESLDPVLQALMQQKQQLDAEKAAKEQGGNRHKLSGQERLSRMFIPKGDRYVIRILPPRDGGSFFKEMYFHNPVVNGKAEKIYAADLNEGQEKSPLTWASEILFGREKDMKGPIFNSFTEQMSKEEKAARLKPANDIRALARQYEPQLYYVIEIIVRAGSTDFPTESGKMFWRFKKRQDGDDVFRKIWDIVSEKGNVSHPLTGRDLIVKCQNIKKGAMNYWDVTSISFNDPTPVFADPAKLGQLQGDGIEAKDVFAPKSMGKLDAQQYMLAILNGEVPKWDSLKNTYTVVSPKQPGEKRLFEDLGLSEQFTYQNPYVAQGGAAAPREHFAAPAEGSKYVVNPEKPYQPAAYYPSAQEESFSSDTLGDIDDLPF